MAPKLATVALAHLKSMTLRFFLYLSGFSRFKEQMLRNCARSLLFVLCLAALCGARGQAEDDVHDEGSPPRDVVVAAIVGVRNVELSVPHFLRLLAPFVNFTIVLDDSSTDGTVAAVESVAREAKVRQVLVKDGVWNRSETADRNELLLAGVTRHARSPKRLRYLLTALAGRRFNATHFVAIDADEVISALWMRGSLWWDTLASLQPGTTMCAALLETPLSAAGA